jgi:hypothetical protein
VRIALRDGRTVVSEPAQARGNPDDPLSDEELRGKYRALAEPVLGRPRATRIAAAVDAVASEANALPALIDELLGPV